MAAEVDDSIALTVTHAGQAHTLSLPETSSLQQLRNAIESMTSVPPSHQKIIYKGKNLIPPSINDTLSTLSSLQLPKSGAKLFLIGSKIESVSSLVSESLAIKKRFEMIHQRESSSSAVHVQPRKTSIAGKRVVDLNDLRRMGDGAFGTIEVLQGCPHEDFRKERLIRLSKDEAVLGGYMYIGISHNFQYN